MTVRREPPTALGVTRDLSGNKERASAVPEGRCMSCGCYPCRCGLDVYEVERQCVCGGVIRTATPLSGDILFAVQTHNRTARHEEWRRLVGR